MIIELKIDEDEMVKVLEYYNDMVNVTPLKVDYYGKMDIWNLLVGPNQREKFAIM